MNKQQFIDYLRDPTTLASNQLDELESIVTDYPYFQSARTLLAKGHKQTKSTRTNKLIASAAVHVPDRKMLKKYINGRLFFIHPQEEVQPEEK